MRDIVRAHIRLDADLKRTVDKLAEADRRSFSSYVVKMLEEYVQLKSGKGKS